jgi:hypothetical protein
MKLVLFVLLSLCIYVTASWEWRLRYLCEHLAQEKQEGCMRVITQLTLDCDPVGPFCEEIFDNPTKRAACHNIVDYLNPRCGGIRGRTQKQ